MRLYFSTDHVRNSTITNGQGQVLYKTVTPFRPFFMKGTSTIWKIVPNSQPIYTGRRRNSSSEVGDDEEDGPQDDDANAVPAGEDVGGAGNSSFEGEEVINTDMQDQFTQLAQIEFRRLQSSRLRWCGANRLGRGEMTTREFIPARGIARTNFVFTGPDGRSYRWHLGLLVCKLYLESDPKMPIAQYHRYKVGGIGSKRTQPGYLEILLPKLAQAAYKPPDGNIVDITDYTDHELEGALDGGNINPELLDVFIVTFIYVEKIREREHAARQDLHWNY
ncbi:hypothetical protein BV22DRAFT_1039093 [Leucogyrophana mollusca]|uniref:Uncharacterized protein n=1 Tax=Leucogyrophana mollusca TaxID=85980 RepID=A0ACB8B5K9_9AGAM|nr:hypothetical protein BV22DRAFT_1039093 [Leucogyrophana mollusca]